MMIESAQLLAYLASFLSALCFLAVITVSVAVGFLAVYVLAAWLAGHDVKEWE